MSTAEQFQLSYINTTSSGINMIATWVRSNYSKNNVNYINNHYYSDSTDSNDPWLTNYNYTLPIHGFMILGMFTTCTGFFYLLMFNTNNQSIDDKYVEIEKKKVCISHRTTCKFYKYFNIVGFLLCILSGFINVNYKKTIIDPYGESIKYCLDDDCKTNPAIIQQLNTKKINRNIYHSEMNNLLPNTKYSYSVGSDSYGWSVPINFETWGLTSGVNTKFSTAIYGDFGLTNSQSLYQLQQYQLKDNYQMVLHIGDMAYNLDTNDGQVGDDFSNKIQPIASKVPYMTCPGNHESPNNFLHYKR